jgi:quercetin dioxygenase-like cupin family protein
MTKTTEPTYLVDNERVQVADWRMAPDTRIGDHVHQYDYLVVGLMEGELVVVAEGGDVAFPIDSGVVFFGNAGDAHDVLNRSDREVRFLEIYLL